MADVSIPREAVDAGLAAFKTMFGFDAHPTSLVEAILNAAAPHIKAAAYERRARQIWAELREEFEGCDVIAGPGAEEAMDQAKELRRLATELRAQS